MGCLCHQVKSVCLIYTLYISIAQWILCCSVHEIGDNGISCPCWDLNLSLLNDWIFRDIKSQLPGVIERSFFIFCCDWVMPRSQNLRRPRGWEESPLGGIAENWSFSAAADMASNFFSCGRITGWKCWMLCHLVFFTNLTKLNQNNYSCHMGSASLCNGFWFTEGIGKHK